MKERDILEICRRENISFFVVDFVDLCGHQKKIEITINTLKRALKDGLSFDGSSIRGFSLINEADMTLFLDLDSFRVLNISNRVYGSFKADIYTSTGRPFDGDSRKFLKRMIGEYSKRGYRSFNVGFEPEFYLLKEENGKRVPLDDSSYFDDVPNDIGRKTRAMITEKLIDNGFDIATHHHEVGPGQNEINYEYSNVLEACDSLYTYIDIVKSVALSNGLIATFMPKPFKDKPGNGMHLNCSIINDDGENVFYDADEEYCLSNLGRHFIGGLVTHAKGMSLLFNSSVNSYKRLNSGLEAPRYITWSFANRQAMIRIPKSCQNRTRIEIRSFDSTANPYLALGTLMACGLKGIDQKIEPPHEVKINLSGVSKSKRSEMGIEELPTTFNDALIAYKEDRYLRKILGTYIYDKYYELKKEKLNEYESQITEYEKKKEF